MFAIPILNEDTIASSAPDFGAHHEWLEGAGIIISVGNSRSQFPAGCPTIHLGCSVLFPAFANTPCKIITRVRGLLGRRKI